MKGRTTLILLGVFTLLCAAYWMSLSMEQREVERVAEAKRLFEFAPEDVATITIQRQGEKPTVGVRRTDGTWGITAPYEIKASQLVWPRVAKNLAELSNERTLKESPEDLTPYGLSDPALQVDARTTGGKDVHLSFGTQDPARKFRYARMDDGPIFLVSTNAFFELDRDLLWLRDRDLIAKSDTPITYIEYARLRRPENSEATPGDEQWEESQKVAAQLGDDGVWRVVEPVPVTADQKMLTSLATELQFAVGDRYIDHPENLADYRLDPPMARLGVQRGPGAPIENVFLGAFDRSNKERGGIFVLQEGAPSVMVVDAQMATYFPTTPEAWNEKRLLTRKGSEIVSIRYDAGEQHFFLNSTDGVDWKIAEPTEQEIDQVSLSSFISTLVDLQGTEYYAEAQPEFGLEQPAITIALAFKDDPNPAVIRVGATTEDGARYYVTQDTGAVITIDAEAIGKLSVTVTDFVSKRLLAFRPDALTKVEMTFEETPYVFEKGERAWLIREPAGKVWESQNDMQALVDALMKCRAEQVELDHTPESVARYGLDRPVMTATVTMGVTEGESPSTSGPIRVGKICDDNLHQRFAVVEGRPEIFRIKQSILLDVRDALRGVVDEKATP